MFIMACPAAFSLIIASAAFRIHQLLGFGIQKRIPCFLYAVSY
jgi:hypothetical protein